MAEANRTITREEYDKLSKDEQALSDAQTLMARAHAIHVVISRFGKGGPIKTIESSDLTEADRASHRRFSEQRGDYTT